MKLATLLNIHGRLDWRQQDPQVQAKSVTADSRQVQPGSVYVAIRGNRGDGHDYLEAAIQQGAIAVVVEELERVPRGFRGATLEVLDGRLSLQSLSQIFYSSPGDRLLALAVTGTNGKTSLTYILEYLLNRGGEDCGVIGTIDHHFKSQTWSTSLTTPDPVTLQKRLRDFVDAGAKAFVIEASSHALHQNRILQGFDGVVFTNLSRDHLDYHASMEEYFLAKAKLFSEVMLKEIGDPFAVLNGDDPYGQRLQSMCPGRRVYTYGQGQGCHLRWALLSSDLEGSEINITLPGDFNFLIKSPLIGGHNADNLLAGLAVIYALGLDFKKVAESFKDFPGVPGRMQRVLGQKSGVGFVDYAHTPDALDKAISALRPLLKDGGRLITVFGCGGDRDQGKRPLMGDVVTRLSDLTIITSDNPRTENPADIVKQICEGIQEPKTRKFMPILDREEAIEQACQAARPGDAILVAGKGHETYQIVGTEARDFDDVAVLKKYLS